MRVISQILLLIVLIAALSGGGVFLINRSSGPSLEIILPSPTPFPQLQVYVSGAVRNPGVYILQEGDRVAQAIEAAGGPSDDADLDQVNLALKIHDEDQWHIPRKGEPLTPIQNIQKGSGSNEIDINTATVEQLDTLPKIGPVLAKAIVAYRETNGPYLSIEDLLNVSGIGPSTLDAIRDLVTAD